VLIAAKRSNSSKDRSSSRRRRSARRRNPRRKASPAKRRDSARSRREIVIVDDAPLAVRDERPAELVVVVVVEVEAALAVLVPDREHRVPVSCPLLNLNNRLISPL
jgi:hypothetical protein